MPALEIMNNFRPHLTGCNPDHATIGFGAKLRSVLTLALPQTGEGTC